MTPPPQKKKKKKSPGRTDLEVAGPPDERPWGDHHDQQDDVQDDPGQRRKVTDPPDVGVRREQNLGQRQVRPLGQPDWSVQEWSVYIITITL